MSITSAMTAPMRRLARYAAAGMMLLGVAAIIMPFYVGFASAVLIGLAIAATGLSGLVINLRLRRAGYAIRTDLAYWLYFAVGVLLTLVPQLTLGLAAWILGIGFLLFGVIGWLGRQHAPDRTLQTMRSLFTLTIGVVILGSGASGIAWLIGVGFGITLLLKGVQLWALVQQAPEIIEH